MPLIRQLWLAISLLMAIAFVGSFIVSSMSAKSYLQEQLRMKNIDNANSLALSLSSSGDDLVTIELMLNAQYDSGHYRFIRFTDPTGKVLIEHSDHTRTSTAPQWLINTFPISTQPGVAYVSDGWRQIGTLTLQSDDQFAYQELWDGSRRLGSYFIVAALIAGIIGSLLLRIITRPLKNVVDQAKAMEERRFITLPTNANTLEFKTLTEAMNSLSARIKQMLADESGRLSTLQKSLERDAITGLLNRAPFLEQLTTRLKREDGSSSGSVVIVRILHLTELNREHGRVILDNFLRQFSEQLKHLRGQDKDYIPGRLNGADFALLAPREFNAEALARQVREMMQACSKDLFTNTIAVAAAASQYQTEDTISQLLSRIDAALATAETHPEGSVAIATSSQAIHPTSSHQLEDWQHIINTAITEKHINLASYPVVDRVNQLLHWEAPSRLVTTDQQTLTAAQFMPWVSRLNRCSDFDCLVVELALQHITNEGQPLGVNLLARTLDDQDGLIRLINIVRQQPESAAKLWIEVPEAGVYQYLESYKTLCQALKPLGCKFGIEHVGPEVAHIGELHDLGLDYLKLDASLCNKVDTNLGNQIFIRGLCTIAHSIGLQAIAEGVSDQQAWECLIELGIDGGTGSLFPGQTTSTKD